MWSCKCNCGCTNKHSNHTGAYCSRCRDGNCPDPDEEVRKDCPECGKRSNKATVREFGYCLRNTCTAPY